MPTYTLPPQTGEYLLQEATSMQSRKSAIVTVTGGQALPSGTVLGRVTATGKWVKHSTLATDGSQTAAAILLTPLPGVNRDHQAVIHDRECEVYAGALNGGLGVDADTRVQLVARSIAVFGAPAVPASTILATEAGPLMFGTESLSFA